MKHPIDEEKKTYNPKDEIQKASEIYRSRRDQILALNTLSGFQYLVEYWENVERICLEGLRNAPLNTDSEKKNLYTIRGEYNIARDFLDFLKNLQKSKDKE